MSARVFNPILVSELKHIRSPGANNLQTNFTARDIAAISPTRRDLFGPVDHEECRIFVERELDRQQNLNMEHWEFDFVNDVPRPGKGRFIWEATYEKTNIRPMKRECIDSDNDISHLYHVPLDEMSPEKEVTTTLVHLNKKQAKITDFLKVTKDGAHQSKLSKIKKSITTPSPRIGKQIRSRRLKI